MAFASSAAAFGIKPATTSQPATSQFGQSNPPKPQNNLFGITPQPTNTFGGFGSQPQAQNQTQAPSLFGSTLGQNTPQQQQGQTGQAPSLFGGGGFGQPQQQQQQQAPSLFGQPASNAQQQSMLGSSLFGNNTGQQNSQPGQQQQHGASGTLFGNTNTGSTLGQSSGLGNWGASTPQSQPNQPANTFGSSLLGGSSANSNSFLSRPAQQSSLSNTQGAPPFTRSTKFNDLPDEVKRVLENVDSFIQGRVQISNDLKQRKLGEEAVKGQEEVHSVHKDLMNVITTLHSDVHHTRDLKSRVDQTVQDTIVATRIVDGFRNPQQSGVYLKNHANFPLEFFNRVTEQMRERLRWYKSTIEQIERKLSSAAAQSQYTPQSITSTLEAQHSTFIALASKTAALNAELQKIKTLYTQLWRARTGSMRDPFNELDRGSGGEFGIEGLSAK